MRRRFTSVVWIVLTQVLVFLLSGPVGASVRGDGAPGLDRAGPAGLPVPIIGARQPASEEPAPASSPELSRLRMILSTSSDWASFTIWGSGVLARQAVSLSSGAELTNHVNGIGISGSPPLSATVDLVFEVGSDPYQYIFLEKGALGTASAELQRVNTTAASIGRLTNTASHGDNSVAAGVDRTALVGEGFHPPRLDPRRLTLAVYYPWFNQGTFDWGRWSTRPARDTAWESNVATSVRWMIDRAAGAGVDGFLVSYTGGGDGSNRSNYQLVYRQAEARGGFLVAPYLEAALILQQGGGVATLVQRAVEALAERNSPAFLRVGTRPVLFVYGQLVMSASTWRSALSQITSAIGVAPFVIGDDPRLDFGYNGYHLYNPNGHSYDALAYDYRLMDAEMRLSTTGRAQRLWAATVTPGFDNTSGTRRGTVRDREGGAWYDATWAAALASNPEWVVITSWNEWYETTQIQPDDTNGWTALNQTYWQTTAWN